MGGAGGRESGRRLRVAVAVLSVVGALSAIASMPAGEALADRSRSAAPPSGASTSSTTPATRRNADRLAALVAEYDRLYAQVVADPTVLYDDPDHELHQRIEDLLTPDSPLTPTRIIDADRTVVADLAETSARR